MDDAFHACFSLNFRIYDRLGATIGWPVAAVKPVAAPTGKSDGIRQQKIYASSYDWRHMRPWAEFFADCNARNSVHNHTARDEASRVGADGEFDG
jgi:hypothetical protein